MKKAVTRVIHEAEDTTVHEMYVITKGPDGSYRQSLPVKYIIVDRLEGTSRTITPAEWEAMNND